MVQGKGAEKMKQGIHPDYHKVIFLDTTTNFKFLSGSTKTSSETMEWEDGNEYPVIRLDVSSDSHPFYTGRQNSLLRMVVWNVSTKVWSQIKQQLILNLKCLPNLLCIELSRYFLFLNYFINFFSDNPVINSFIIIENMI